MAFLGGIEQTLSGGRDFVEELLRNMTVFTHLKRLKMDHALIGCMINNVKIGFVKSNSKQSVMTGGLFFWRNAQPFVVCVESRHDVSPLAFHVPMN